MVWISPKNCSNNYFLPDLLLSLNGANCLFISQIGWCILISKFPFSKSHSLKPSFILPTLGNVTGSLSIDSFGCFVGLRKSGQLLGTVKTDICFRMWKQWGRTVGNSVVTAIKALLVYFELILSQKRKVLVVVGRGVILPDLKPSQPQGRASHCKAGLLSALPPPGLTHK